VEKAVPFSEWVQKGFENYDNWGFSAHEKNVLTLNIQLSYTIAVRPIHVTEWPQVMQRFGTEIASTIQNVPAYDFNKLLQSLITIQQ
jgi:hypothetical protein